MIDVRGYRHDKNRYNLSISGLAVLRLRKSLCVLLRDPQACRHVQICVLDC